MKRDSSVSLGKYAKNAAQAGAVDPVRARRYHLQNLAADLLPDERVSECLRAVAPSADQVDIVRNSVRSSARYANLIVCSRVWTCPVCAARITEQRRQELTLAAASADLSPLLVTFTLRHKKSDRLSRVLDVLLQSVRAFKSGSRWQKLKDRYFVAGSIRSLEVTYGENGWHPHCHMMLLIEGKISDRAARQMEKEFRALWLSVVAHAGFDASWDHGLDVRSADRDVQDYIVKFGREPLNSGWTPEHELVKGHIKKSGGVAGRSPFELLASYGDGDKRAGDLFVEYARVFKGRNQLVWSRGLRDRLGLGGEVDDPAPVSDLVGDIEAVTEKTLLSLSREQWRVVVRSDARSALLDVAALGDVDRVWAWLGDLPGFSSIISVELSQLMGRPFEVARYLHSLGVGDDPDSS